MSVRPGRLVFIAGQVAVDEKGDVVGRGDFQAQVRQVFHNLGAVLASAGASFEDVVQFTTFVVRSHTTEEFIAARGEIYPQIFPNASYPPNTLVFIDGLVRQEFLVEIEAIAALP